MLTDQTDRLWQGEGIVLGANRHGLITGATGTGKTVTLQKLAVTVPPGPVVLKPLN
ncbi:DUF853 family protein, partial [Klebsiella pneumoniae]